MFIVLSPAKTLDFATPLPTVPPQSAPRFLDDSAYLVDLLRKRSPARLATLMGISDKLAHLNVERFSLWRSDMAAEAARPCVFAFRGDVYTGLDIDSFTQAQLRATQERLRILSGLHGLLKPLDRIRPYRLEMGTSLPNKKGRDLYAFWGKRLTQRLAADMEEQGSKILVNLASQEYFKAIRAQELPFPLVSPVFEDEKNGQHKIISFYAKKARGLMAAWILKNSIVRADDLAAFDVDGYTWHKASSTAERPVFRRREQVMS